MNSYQKLKSKIEYLEKENKVLKDSLYEKYGKVFWGEVRWLGYGEVVTGLMINEKFVSINRIKPIFRSDNKIKHEIIIP